MAGGSGAPGVASGPASTINMVNNIVGAGLLSMPWVFRQSSMMLGGFMLLLVMYLNLMALLMLARCCDISKSFSYKQMGDMAFGRWAGLAVQWTVLLTTFMSCITYVILVGDFVPTSIEYFRPDFFGFTQAQFRAGLQALVSASIFLPLSALRNLDMLKYPSSFAFVCILYAAGLLTVRCATAERLKPVNVIALNPCMGGALPIINVAFTLHYNVPRFYMELRNRTIKRFARVSMAAYGLSGSMYAIASVTGYLLFGSQTEGNILNSFDADDEAAVFARLSLAVVIIFTYPLAFHALRNSVLILVFPHLTDEISEVVPQLSVADDKEGAQSDSMHDDDGTSAVAGDAGDGAAEGGVVTDGEAEEDEEVDATSKPVSFRDTWPGFLQFMAVNLALVTITTVLGITFTEVEVVLAYKGATFGSLIVYIYPAMLYARFCYLEEQRRRNGGGNDEHTDGDVILEPRLEKSVEGEGSLLLGSHHLKGLCGGKRRGKLSDKALVWFMLFWGVALGLVGIVITALDQAKLLEQCQMPEEEMLP